METRATAEAESERSPGDGARPGYADAIEHRFKDLRDEEREIIDLHLLGDTALTLEQIGELRSGVTRERIRQIEVRGIKRLVAPVVRRAGRPRSDRPEGAALDVGADVTDVRRDTALIADAVERVRGIALPITEGGFIAAGFESFDELSTRLLLIVAKKAKGAWRGVVEEHGGRRWLVGHATPARLMARVTDDVRDVGVAEDMIELREDVEARIRPHVGSDDEAEDLAAEVMEQLNIVEVGERCAILGGGIGAGERLVRVLRANGEPMTLEDLTRPITGHTQRYLQVALYDEPRIVQIRPKLFSLTEWGAEKRPTLLGLVFGAIDEHGSVAIDYLERLAAEHHYSPKSITFYRGLPELIEDAGALRRRTASDPSGVLEPGLDDRCVRVAGGAHRGQWSVLERVSHRRLYAGPQKMPAPLARLLGLEPGVKRKFVTVNGTEVPCTWGSYPYFFGGPFRRVLDAAGFVNGEAMRVVVLAAADVTVEHVPDLGLESGPFVTLVTGAGLYDETGTVVSFDEIVPCLAYAVGLEAEAPLTQIERRLAARHDHAFYDAFGLVFADQLGA